MQAAMCSIAWKPEPIEAIAPLVAAAVTGGGGALAFLRAVLGSALTARAWHKV